MNQKMLDLLGEDYADKYPKFLEQHFPHVFQKMIELWGTNQMLAYFDELIMSNRPNRQGFPPEAVMEIWALHRVYSDLHPQDEIEESETDIDDVWGVDIDVERDSWKYRAEKKSSES